MKAYNQDPQEVPKSPYDIADDLRRDAYELKHGVAMSNFTLANICEALALLLERQK